MDLLKGIDYNAMNYIDVGIIAIITLSVLFGVIRGFMMSAISLLGWVVSIIIAYQYAPILKKLLPPWLSSDIAQLISSYSILLVISLIIFSILNSILAKVTLGMRGGFFDRSLGALFGLFRGALISSFLFMCINFCFIALVEDEKEEALPEVIRKAQSYKLLKIGNTILLDFMPMTFDKSFKNFADDFLDNTVKDKFIGEMIRKMYKNMNEDDVNEIESEIKERGIKDDNELITTIFDFYKKKGDVNKLGKKNLERLENIINGE